MTTQAESLTERPVAFMDLATQRQRLRTDIDAAIARVLDHGQYILGPEVTELERRLADYCGVEECVSCASGTDALLLPLLTEGIGPGDAVFVPSFTFVATAEVVVLTGATPVFVDVDAATYMIDPASLESAIDQAKKLDLTPRAVIPVDLFGQAADYASLASLSESAGLYTIADAAQSFGGRQGNQRVGTLAPVTATSFFPSKPLGCFGDGGALFTNDAELAARLRSVRVHGAGTDKYDNARVGVNSRLDTMQAAILLAKMTIFDDEIAARQRVAANYEAGLADYVRTPALADGNASAWALYTILTPHRDRLKNDLMAADIPSRVYYPTPLHQQPAYAHHPRASSALPITERLAGEVLSLPMHPYLDETGQQRVIQTVRELVGSY